MFKVLLFACVALCGIFAVRSNPRKRSVISDTTSTSPLGNEENIDKASPRINDINPSCSCMINGTSFDSMPGSQNLPIIPNVLPLGSTSSYVWKCSLVPNKPVRDDYRCSPGIGTHKLHTRAKVWNEARKVCLEEGGHLAIINSQAEAYVLMEMFNKSTPFKDAAYQNEVLVGIHDIFAEGDWVTVHGDSMAKTGYSVWSDKWGGQPDNGGGIQNCGALLDDGKLDDVSCDVAFAFFCEIPSA